MSAAQKYSAGFGVATLIAFVSWLTISAGYPKPYAPLNLSVVAPLMWGYEAIGEASTVLAILIVPVFFCVWSIPALHRDALIPFRSFVLMVVAIALSAISLVFGYEYGIQYQNTNYVVSVVIFNLACYVTIVGLAIAGRKRPGYFRSLLFHGALFTWLAWMAFPWLGELP